MQSLACVAAEMANINSFSLLPLGLAWMTSAFFTWRVAQSNMEEKHICFKHSNFRCDLDQFDKHLTNWSCGKQGIRCAALKLKVVAGLTVQRSQDDCYVHSTFWSSLICRNYGEVSKRCSLGGGSNTPHKLKTALYQWKTSFPPISVSSDMCMYTHSPLQVPQPSNIQAFP